jgi:hypothetical protein
MIVAKRLPRSIPSSRRDSPRGGSLIFKIASGTVVGVLLVTNVMTCGALKESAQRLVAVQRAANASKSVVVTSGIATDRSQRLLAERNGADVPLVAAVAKSPESAPTGGPAVTSIQGAQLAKKLTDPASREALLDQQKGIVLQSYGELLRRWHLAKAEAEPILNALADYELRQFANALAPGSAEGALDAGNANAADAAAVRTVLTDQQLEDLRSYDTTLQDRMAIAPFLSELDLTQTPLSPDLAEQLISIMHDERVEVSQPSPPIASQPPGAYGQAMREWQADLDQRILDRASVILSSDVLARLQSFQEGQRAASSIFASVTANSAQSADAPATDSTMPVPTSN